MHSVDLQGVYTSIQKSDVSINAELIKYENRLLLANQKLDEIFLNSHTIFIDNIELWYNDDKTLSYIIARKGDLSFSLYFNNRFINKGNFHFEGSILVNLVEGSGFFCPSLSFDESLLPRFLSEMKVIEESNRPHFDNPSI
jgi:hypothetical protein